MRLLILILMLIFAINAIANEKQSSLIVAYAYEIRPEKSVQNEHVIHNLTNWAVGTKYDQFLFFLERATFEESSGNSTLNQKRLLEDWMLWADYQGVSWNHLIPYFGGGAGFYKERVETTLLGETTTNDSNNKLLVGANLGLAFDIPYLWVSAEARMLFGDELDRQGALGGLLRLGFHF